MLDTYWHYINKFYYRNYYIIIEQFKGQLYCTALLPFCQANQAGGILRN